MHATSETHGLKLHPGKLTGRPAVATDEAPHHFIGQDAADAVVVQVDEPVEPLHLVVTHLAALDDGGLHRQPVSCTASMRAQPSTPAHEGMLYLRKQVQPAGGWRMS